jgi:2-iminobutanoate/2-iminopropanoate deaminase
MHGKTVVNSNAAPVAIGPYSQAILAGEWLFVSGQIPLDKNSGKVVGDDIKAQTIKVLDNLSAIIKSADFTLEDVVKTTVYLIDLAHFNEFNQVYATYFTKNPPARATVGVAGLPKGVLVEIEAIARREA